MTGGLDRDEVARLREALLTADYTAEGVLDLLGPVAHAALARSETAPARRATTDSAPLATLVRLFLLQLPVPEAVAGAALPLDVAFAGGLVTASGGEVRARVDVRPYGADDAPADAPWWVVSDLGSGLDGAARPLPPDHVLGVGGASTTLAEITVRDPVGRALDVGTGCGVQALHLDRHAAHVVATDVLPRALAMARLSAGLSAVDVELRAGSLYAPVAGERYDLVVSNPPFVVAPEGRYAYRDSGLPGDAVCARLVAGAAAVLADGGTLQLLANWVHRRGEDWRDRVAGWLPWAPGSGFDAWVVQREVLDPAAYVSTWLHDSGEARGPAFLERYDGWLAALEADDVEGVGFGWMSLRATGSDPGTARLVDWPHAVDQPLGPEVAAWFARQDWLRAHGGSADLLAARLRVAGDVVQEQLGAPDAEDPERIVLRRRRGLRPARGVDTVTAGLVGACDGILTVGSVLAAVAALLEVDPGEVRRDALPAVRALVEDGFLAPVP